MKSLRDLRRVSPINSRGAGRAHLEGAVEDIRPYRKDIIPVIGMPDDVASRFAFFCEWVDGIDDDAAAIADDEKAGRLLHNVALRNRPCVRAWALCGRRPPGSRSPWA